MNATGRDSSNARMVWIFSAPSWLALILSLSLALYSKTTSNRLDDFRFFGEFGVAGLWLLSLCTSLVASLFAFVVLISRTAPHSGKLLSALVAFGGLALSFWAVHPLF